jgi:hypothetical protein
MPLDGCYQKRHMHSLQFVQGIAVGIMSSLERRVAPKTNPYTWKSQSRSPLLTIPEDIGERDFQAITDEQR